MITIYQRTKTDKQLKVINTFKTGSWIHVEDPSEEESLQLEGSLPLDASLLKDALDPHEVPRVEMEKRVLYIFTRVPHVDEGRISTTPALIAVGQNFVMTFSKKPLPFLDRFIDGRINFSTTQKTLLVLTFFSEMVRTYNGFLTRINREVRSKSVHLEKVDNRTIVGFVNFEEILNDFLAALVPTNVALQRLLRGKYLKLYEEDQDLVEDLVLSTGQFVELCRANLKTIVNIRESYSTIVTNDLNKVIKFLTSVTVILAVPTMIASFYGMNVRLPLGDYPAAFWGIAGIVLVIVAALLYIFNKKDWL